MKDSQRQKVYDAELPLWGRWPKFESVADVERFFDRLLGQKLVERRFGRTWTRPGTVAAIGGGHGGGVYFRGRRSRRAQGDGWGSYTVVVSGKNLEPMVAVHELAHHLTRFTDPAHGWEFCDAMLWLTRRAFGAELANELRASYRRTGARFTAPRPKRSLSPEQAEANRERLAAFRARQAEEREAERGEWVIEEFRSDVDPKLGRYRWAEVGGAGSHRGIQRWTTWPPNATVYQLRSSAQKWADRYEYGEGATLQVVTAEQARQNYEAMVAERHQVS